MARPLRASIFSRYVVVIWALYGLVTVPPLTLAVLLLSRRRTFGVLKAWIGGAFLLAGLKATSKGAERVDWSRPLVLLANHESMLDHLAMVLTLPVPVVGLEKVENMKIPLYGRLAKAWGNIPVVREDREKAHAAVAQAVETLRAGTALVVMPEGTRSKDGKLGAFKKGGFHLAIDAAADIVPVAVNGAYECCPGTDWHVWPGTIEIVYGDPIPAAGVAKTDMEPLIHQTREAIAAMRDADPEPAALPAGVAGG